MHKNRKKFVAYNCFETIQKSLRQWGKNVEHVKPKWQETELKATLLQLD